MWSRTHRSLVWRATCAPTALSLYSFARCPEVQTAPELSPQPIYRARLAASEACGAGSGIANGGTATLNLSQVDHHSAPGSSGGGILNHGTATLNGRQIDDNWVPNDGSGDLGDGGGIANFNFDAEIEGGGVTNPPPSGVLTPKATQVVNNTASGRAPGSSMSGLTGC